MNPDFNHDFLVQSDSYCTVMERVVLPWLEKKQHETMVSGFQGSSLYAVHYQAENPVGTVFIVHGFT